MRITKLTKTAISTAAKVLSLAVIISATSTTASAETIPQLLLSGKPRGTLGMYTQVMSGSRPSFVDAYLNMGYDSASYFGYTAGGGFWVAPKIFQRSSGDHKKVKRAAILSEIFLKFENPNRLNFAVGRFDIDEEWVKHYAQGAVVRYQAVPNVELGALWAQRSAYATHYRLDDFYNPFGSRGAFMGYADITMSGAPLKVKPYFYTAHNAFNVFGVRFDLMTPLASFDPDMVFFAKMHFASYIERGRKDPTATKSGDGGFAWLEGGVIYVGAKIGGGVISISEKGASGIDAFGQSTPFERREGIFYSNATTLYGFVEYELRRLMTLQGALRTTSLGSDKNVLNWELGVKFNPQENVEVGGGVVGMVNNAPETLDNQVFEADGKSYLLFRGYAQLRF